MKNKEIYLFVSFILFLLIACSTKRSTFMSRNTHALSANYNILYNGNLALDKAILEMKESYKDNFWELLPVEIVGVAIKSDGLDTTKVKKNADFERAETKAVKAVQKHSIYIDGKENNSKIDDAYLLLGKVRYYEARYLPAMEAFNFILYKSAHSNIFLETKLWRERTNIRLENEILAKQNLQLLLQNKNLTAHEVAQTQSVMADCYINLGQKDSAITKLKSAQKLTKNNSNRARYRFIIAQLYEETKQIDSANAFYQSVINMHRRADKKYYANAWARKAMIFDKKKDSLDLFVMKYNKVLNEPENEKFFDILYYGFGMFYEKLNEQELAVEYYNLSLRTKSEDSYLWVSNYRNMGDMAFGNTKYQLAAKYYDSTLTKFEKRTKEFFAIQRKRKNLDEVIELEKSENKNNTILKLVDMTNDERVQFFKDSLDRIKKREEEKLSKTDKKDNVVVNQNPFAQQKKIVGTENTAGNTFYFYNPTVVTYGKVDFQKKWGNIELGANWKMSATKNLKIPEENVHDATPEETVSAKNQKEEEETQRKIDLFISEIPTSPKEIDSIRRERNNTSYQLGVIYEEKFKAYKLAAHKLEVVLQNKPQEDLILPTYYNLYKIYTIIDKQKAKEMKDLILEKYPDSQYSQIINKKEVDSSSESDAEKNYKDCYTMYREGNYKESLDKCDKCIAQYSGKKICSKFELLRAMLMGKLYGVLEYKNALKEIEFKYPKRAEGIMAAEIIKSQIPLMEQRTLITKPSARWRVIYRIESSNKQKIKEVLEIITKFANSEKYRWIKPTNDVYTVSENLITIPGLETPDFALYLVDVFKNNPAYRIDIMGVVLSDENYEVVQIKKNLQNYLSTYKN